jgi:hypothetical protein
MKRSRELTLQLIKLKKDLNAKFAKLEEKHLQEREELAKVQAQLKRAYIFTQRHSYRDIPYCPKCFIDKNKLATRNSSPSKQSGAQTFNCVCGHALTIETDSNL